MSQHGRPRTGRRPEPTPAQREAAEQRRARFRELAGRLAAMTEAQRAEMAARMPAVATIEGRALSLGNTLLLGMQRPDVTLVGGFRQWLAAGRCVRKGEHGLSLWIPTGRDGDSTDRDPGADATTDHGPRPGFIMGTVFDVSQTDPTTNGGPAHA